MLTPQDKSRLPRPQLRFSRPTASLLRRFTDLYKSSAALASVVPWGKQPAHVPPTNETKHDDTTGGRNQVRVVHFELPESVCIIEPARTSQDSSNTDPSHSAISSSSSSSSSDSGSHHAGSSPNETLDLGLDLRLCYPASPSPPPTPAQIKPLRPALKQTSSWSSTSTTPSTRASTHDLHVSFLIPRRERSESPRCSSSSPDGMHMQLHPLFAYTRLDHAPISCDIAFPPSSRTIRSRGGPSGGPIPARILAQPATQPPVYTQLVLSSAMFPWEIVVVPDASGTAPTSAPHYHRRIRRLLPVTNYDVLCALHDALSERVTSDEWASVPVAGDADSTNGPSSPLQSTVLGLTQKQKHKQKQRRVLRAYEDRCVARRRVGCRGAEDRLAGGTDEVGWHYARRCELSASDG
ncbi:hypothetical protein C8F01DRAFT_1057635 [Mycena amicta]|nr:hypothetical protein C8F01DRAFT_1057635 [Mycena amicta]